MRKFVLDVLETILSIFTGPRQPLPDGMVVADHPSEPRLILVDAGEWADEQWRRWENGATVFVLSSEYQSPVCPACFHRSGRGISSWMSDHHHDRAARRRWFRSVVSDRRKVEALGACRCGRNIGEQEADDSAETTLSKYGNFSNGRT